MQATETEIASPNFLLPPAGP